MTPDRSSSFEQIGDYAMEGEREGLPAEALHARPVIARDTSGLASFCPSAGAAPGVADPVNWDIVHAVVQDALAPLPGWIAEACPGVRWWPGRSTARAFHLFSYRTFSRDDDIGDPVVVGVVFAGSGTGIRISGDISGEETGRVYYDEGCEQVVPLAAGPISEGAARIAGRLAAQHRIVAGALQGPGDGAVPR